MRHIALGFLGLLIAATVSAAPPTLEIPRTTASIKIDGSLSDPGWRTAGVTEDFTQYQPVDKVRPEVVTRVYATYDDENLYLGFYCQDAPAAIRKTLADRDQMYDDDFIGIVLDTYGDAAWAYEFYVNPLGVQGDLRWVSSGGEDSRFDLVYRSAAEVTDSGWQAEMAIPFSSLRFPDAPEQAWRATFWRSYPRDVVRKFSWAPIAIGEPCFFCQMGYLTGIKGVRPGSKIDLLPSVVAYQSGGLREPDDLGSSFHNLDPDAEGELNGRYRLNDVLTVEATINPDFSQVESDAAQIDVNSNFALYYPERRPFFQEGGDLYNTYIDAIYTRAINDPSAAMKLTGRSGRASYFFLSAIDNNSPLLIPLEERSAFVPLEKSYSSIGRIRRTLGRDSHLGALFTDRRIDRGDGTNTVYGADGAFRFFDKWRLEFQVLGSHTTEPDRPDLTADFLSDERFDNGRHTLALDGETFDGLATFLQIYRSSRRGNFGFSYTGLGPTFRADDGFLFRNSDRTVESWGNLVLRPDGRIVSLVQLQLNTARIWNYEGTRKDEWLAPGLSIELTGQTEIDMNLVLSRELYRSVWFDDIRRLTVGFYTGAFEAVRFGGSFGYGNSIARYEDPLPVMGRQTMGNVWTTIKPVQQLSIHPEYQYYKLLNRDTGERIEEGYVVRTRVNYQFTRRLFARMVVQYDDFDERLNIEPLLTYKVNPFTIFYVGSTSHYAWDNSYDINGKLVARQFFLKLQYLFRV